MDSPLIQRGDILAPEQRVESSMAEHFRCREKKSLARLRKQDSGVVTLAVLCLHNTALTPCFPEGKSIFWEHEKNR